MTSVYQRNMSKQKLSVLSSVFTVYNYNSDFIHTIQICRNKTVTNNKKKNFHVYDYGGVTRKFSDWTFFYENFETN